VQVGKTIPVNVGSRSVDGVLAAADVASDGRSARLTVDVADAPEIPIGVAASTVAG
jgi:hypothetical protein